MKKTKNSLSKENQKKLFKDVKMFCLENGKTQRALCRQMGFSETPFSLIIRGHQNPGRIFWMCLEEVTDGQIKRGDYYDD